MNPSQRSLALLRKRGYDVVQNVEYWNPYAKRRKDLFGFLDILAMRKGTREILGVQTTSGSNLSARIKKAQALEAYHTFLACGGSVEFHGWRKIGKPPRWKPRLHRIDPIARLL